MPFQDAYQNSFEHEPTILSGKILHRDQFQVESTCSFSPTLNPYSLYIPIPILLESPVYRAPDFRVVGKPRWVRCPSTRILFRLYVIPIGASPNFNTSIRWTDMPKINHTIYLECMALFSLAFPSLLVYVPS